MNEQIKIGSIIKQIRGVSYKPTDVREADEENAVALLRANNIQETGLNFDDLVYIDRSMVKSEQYLQAGDILICSSSGSKNLVGKAAYVPKDLPCSFGAFCKVVRTQTVDSYYLGQYFQSPRYRQEISEASAGANINNIRNEHIDELTIPAHSKSEQMEIVQILLCLNKQIDCTKQQLAKLDELVKSRFIEMFDTYAETTKLSDVATVSGGLTKNANRDKLPLRMPYLRVANVFFASVDVSEMLDIGLTEEEYKKTVLHYEDLLFVEGNGSPDQIGRVAIWRNEIEPCVHQNHLIKARFDKGQVIPTFAMYYFMSTMGREQIKAKAVSTSGLYTLSVSKISDLMLPVPPLDLQNRFATLVEQTDKSKLVVQQALEKLETLKKSLMQQYFG